MNPTENPMVELINKRLRAQRKRLTKIEKYEGLEKSLLDADQIATISRKPEVCGNIKELEGVLEQYIQLNNEAIKKREEELFSLNEEHLLQITAAECAVEGKHQEYMNFSSKVTFALNIPMATLVGIHPISEEEFAALLKLKSHLFGPFSGVTIDDYVNSASNTLKNIFDKLETPFLDTSLTFEGVYNLIVRLLLPQPEPKFGMFEVSRAAENSDAPALATLPASTGVYMPAFPSSINFLSHSLQEMSLKKTEEKVAEVEEAQLPTEEELPVPGKVDDAPVSSADSSSKPKRKRYRKPKSSSKTVAV